MSAEGSTETRARCDLLVSSPVARYMTPYKEERKLAIRDARTATYTPIIFPATYTPINYTPIVFFTRRSEAQCSHCHQSSPPTCTSRNPPPASNSPASPTVESHARMLGPVPLSSPTLMLSL
uniref:Uncharacterized protein n=1 Tax=Cryptomonas curvata TaxID=233186 RepID=A0A7S0N2V9_9CRYP